MKNLLSLFLAVALAQTSFGQFSIETELYEGVVPLTGFTDHQVDCLNESGDSLHLAWKFISNTCPPEWTYALCDFGFCYDGIPLSGIMQPIPETADGFLKLSVWANGVAGGGDITFWVSEESTPTEYQTVVFRFNPSATSLTESAVPAISCSPNPARDRVNIALPASEGTVQLIGLNGAVVRKIVVSTAQLELDIAHLESGVYFLQYAAAGNRWTERLVIQ